MFLYEETKMMKQVRIFRCSPEATIVKREGGGVVSIFTIQPNDIDEKVLALKTKKMVTNMPESLRLKKPRGN